jgi:hypothetical protein
MRQDASLQVLSTYQDYPVIEHAIESEFDTIYELERWDQGASTTVDFIVEWKKDELMQTTLYIVSLHEEKPLLIDVILNEYTYVRLEYILACLGNPSHFAVTPYLFPYEGTEINEDVDMVTLYFTAQELQLELIKPHSHNVRGENADLYLRHILIFPEGKLNLEVSNPTYPPKEDIKDWKTN